MAGQEKIGERSEQGGEQQRRASPKKRKSDIKRSMIKMEKK
jgi:hypothetical protein